MSSRKALFKRLFISLAVGLALGAAISEIPFILLHETTRPPKEIVLTIPPGTAEQVARGEQPPSIPENMIFVVGDTLIVKNEDSVDHKLGPLWIPASASAELSLRQEENLAYECTFQPGKYLGLDVHEPLTLGTRLYGIVYAGLPMALLILLYSLAMPPKKDKNAPA
jgi:hypothetical protein